MRLWRPRNLRTDITAVVFTADNHDLSRFAVATGPCVPLAEGQAPLLSPLAQDGGETPELTASLYVALTGRSGQEALELVEQVGDGMLSRFSPGFVQALSACQEESQRLGDEDEARGDHAALTSFTEYSNALCSAWLRAGPWPREVVSLWNRLPARMGYAREATATGRTMFAWHGPPVPTVRVVSGTGPYSG
jgi:hypothetical protein